MPKENAGDDHNQNSEEINLKEKEWEKQQELIQPLVELGAERFFRNNLAGLGKAFEPIPKVLACIDEGIEKRAFRIAGSGIMMPLGDFVEYVKRNSIEGIYTHAGCGAAALAAKNVGWAGHPEEYAKQWATEAANLTGIEYLGHIEMQDMHRPGDYHNAVAAYYIGGDRFSQTGVDHLPRGFHAHRKLGKHVIENLELAVAIAMGDHGFGKKRFAQKPFRLIVVGNPNDETRNFKALVAETLPILQKYPGLVVVDGFNLADAWLAGDAIAA